MAQTNDHICDVCRESCAAKAAPLVVYIVAGTPPNYRGKPFDASAPGVRVPDFVREILARGGRVEMCVEDFAAAFGLPLVEAPPRDGDASSVTQTQSIREEAPPGSARANADPVDHDRVTARAEDD